MFEYELATDVPTWVVAVQVVPTQRYMLYPVTATLSVEAVHETLTADEEMAEAERFVGIDGEVVSAGGVVDRVANVGMLEMVETFPAESDVSIAA